MLTIKTTDKEDNTESYRTKAWDLFLELLTDGLAGSWKIMLGAILQISVPEDDNLEDSKFASMVRRVNVHNGIFDQ